VCAHFDFGLVWFFLPWATRDSDGMPFPQEKLQEEQKTIRAEIGKLHAEIWRLVRGRNSAFVDQIAQCRLEIESNTRRAKSIDYLLAHKNEWSEN
jgi:hypothetical protein